MYVPNAKTGQRNGKDRKLQVGLLTMRQTPVCLTMTLVNLRHYYWLGKGFALHHNTC